MSKKWDEESVSLSITSLDEEKVFGYMRYNKKYDLWSTGQIIARIKNLAQQRRNRVSHETGAE